MVEQAEVPEHHPQELDQNDDAGQAGLAKHGRKGSNYAFRVKVRTETDRHSSQ